MTKYAIYFHQQWVGDHTEEWFLGRVKPSNDLVDEMEAAGVLVFAGGLQEDRSQAFSADATSGEAVVTDGPYTAGPYTESTEYLGGITVIDVPDEAAAREWAAKLAVACGWPQEVRVIV